LTFPLCTLLSRSGTGNKPAAAGVPSGNSRDGRKGVLFHDGSKRNCGRRSGGLLRIHPYGNSVGHLVLHMTGNLNYYIGARVAETGYVRDRDREFTDKQPPPKEEALAAFVRTIAMVVAAIRKQNPEDWGKAYTAQLEPEAADRFQIFLRCAGHAYHHVGQILYLSRELART